MRRFRCLLIAILGILLTCPGLAQTLIKVYVQAGSGGFAANGANDTSLDVRKALQSKSRTLRVVDSSAEADVVVRIDSRNERTDTSSVSTYANESKDGKDGRSSTATTVANKTTVRVIHATLLVGDFQMPIENESSLSWRLAASDIASSVDHWVKENYAKLIQRSVERQPAPASVADATPRPEQKPADATSTAESSISPGMTEAEVLGALGPPTKKVTFGQKSLWNYRGMQVVFDGGKVADVKF